MAVLDEPAESPQPLASLEPPANGIDLTQAASRPIEEPMVEARSIASLEWEGSLSNVQFAPDGAKVYAADSDKGIAVYETEKWRRTAVWPWDGESLTQVLLSRDGTTLAAADDSGMVSVWSTQSGELITKYEHRPEELVPSAFRTDVEALAISPDGRLVVSSITDTFDYVAWEPHSGRLRWRKKTRWRDVKPVAFDSRGETLLLWDDYALVQRAAGSGEELRRAAFVHDSLDVVLFSPDGQRILVGIEDEFEGERRGYLGLLSTDSLELLWAAETRLVWWDGLAFSPDGRHIVLVGEARPSAGRQAEFRDTRDGTVELSFKSLIWNDGAPTFSPDGRLLVVSGYVWETPKAP